MNRASCKDYRVSVVIPAHNAAPYIGQALESVFAQGLDGVQVIVVENGSTDSTADVAEQFGRGVTVVRSSVRGAQQARNLGIAMAAGRYLKMLDADDRLTDGALLRQLSQAEDVERLEPNAFVYGDFEYISAAGEPLGVKRFRPLAAGENPLAHALENAPLVSAPLHQTALVQAVGGFDETLPREHETDLYFRLLLSGAVARHFPEVTFQYRQHTDGTNIMSGGVAKYGPLWPYEYLERRRADFIAVGEGKIPDDCRVALGRRYWREGRAILREGYTAESRTYFARAKEIAGAAAISGSGVYRALARVAGPRAAEAVGGRTATWKRS